MRMRLLFKWNTRVGTFFIGQSDDGRFHPIYEDVSLGSYARDWQASEDLANGATFSIPDIPDTSRLGIPDHVAEWERVS